MDSESTESVGSSSAGSERDVFNLLQIDMTQLDIGSVISEGPNSIVRVGYYRGHSVAIKRIETEKGTNMSPERIEKFRRQVRMFSKVQHHDNIVRFFAATMDTTLTIVTEIMIGGSLQKHLSNIQPFTIDIKDALLIALDISRAMEYLHSNNIIHLDLKPSNIFLEESKTSAKLRDCGLCREGLEGDLSAEVGSYRWIAPELYIEPGTYNHKADVYSFSIVVWELITNKTPFMGMNNQMIAQAVANDERPNLDVIPDELQNFLHSCWLKNPKLRPEFKQISQTLEEFLADEEFLRNITKNHLKRFIP